MTVGERYASIVLDCSSRELAIVWDALLLGRCATLDDRLRAIAAEINALRAETWASNVGSNDARSAIRTDPDGRVQPEGVV